MLKMMLTFLILTFSFMMFFLNHPLSMGMMILLQTFLICLLSGMMMKTYWFSYILFLTFLGGLLVLFIYMSSIASNELFIMSFKMKNMMLISFGLILLSSFLWNNLYWMNLSFNSDMDNLFNLFMFFNNENKINLSNLYNNQTFLLMLMLIIYLFITLISIVKITNIFYGPLRQSN